MSLDKTLNEIRQARALQPEVSVALIQSRKRVTTAEVAVTIGQRVFVGTGGSACDSHDKPDVQTGVEMAVARALLDAGRAIRRDAWKRVEA